jgi:hypothetical protein
MIKKRIIELSLKYNILSPYTAFIAVQKRINANNDDMVLREIPIQISADDQHLQIHSPQMFMNSARLSSMSNAVNSSFCVTFSDDGDACDLEEFERKKSTYTIH